MTINQKKINKMKNSIIVVSPVNNLDGDNLGFNVSVEIPELRGVPYQTHIKFADELGKFVSVIQAMSIETFMSMVSNKPK